MYADRVESGARVSVRDRLNGNAVGGSARRRQITGKRLREDDDKWEHDLYEADEPQISSRKLGVKDLRLKLQKRSTQETSQSLNRSVSRGTRDLREKLSGTIYSEAGEVDPSKPKRNPAPDISKPVRKSVIAEAPVLETKKVASTISKKKSQQKAESVGSFLQSLGLEKYEITFQAEEVDMAALIHMTDEDLKAMGIPMGPRKKILLALESKR
ncbi:ankyrin repeat and SAM domain-containing protein 6 [Ipomoea triloba]|uniref:ankyrin repeat and SAM domain-containing protein 6 n=1 Tax=Ipomoea triloba TaxID=35885 RepID=UPI00125D2CF8|nr:ankyrin repeat and SAM domain-containing protein 6 [Ipomoea triloba]